MTKSRAGGLVLLEPGTGGGQDQLQHPGGGRFEKIDLEAEHRVLVGVMGEAALDCRQELAALVPDHLTDGGLQSHPQPVYGVALLVEELRRLGRAADGDGLQSVGIGVLQGLHQQRDQARGGRGGVVGHKPAAQEGLCLAPAGETARRGGQGCQGLLQQPGTAGVPAGGGELAGEIVPGQVEVPALLEVLVVSGVGDKNHAAVPAAQDVLPQHAVEKEAPLLPAHPELPAVVVVAQLGGGETWAVVARVRNASDRSCRPCQRPPWSTSSPSLARLSGER